ncbi:MAG: VWA domain-containing protein [Clostridiales bacterium]|jgi:Mg-chelatase subunit ChlD|nr:VWA domain-containing protein [Clostridiales bacterium]
MKDYFKRILTLALFVAAIFTFSTNASAQEPVNISNVKNSVLFVVDCSNSMNSNDSDRLVCEIIKMFADGARLTNTEIGLLTYNDSILLKRGFFSVSDESALNSFKADVDSMSRFGSTDIGLALNYGMDMFDENAEGRRAVALISDGVTDLTYTRTGRDYNDSLYDENSALEKAKKLHAPIYSFGVNVDDMEYLRKISSASNGKLYSDADYSKLALTLLKDAIGVTFETGGAIGGGAITFASPLAKFGETVVLLWHGGAAHTGANIAYDSRKYLCAVTSGESWTFSADAAPSFAHFMKIKPAVTPIDDVYAPEVTIDARLLDEHGNDLPLFYEGASAELTLENMTDGQTTVLTMENSGTSFAALYHNDKPGPFNISVSVSGSAFSARSDDLAVGFSNNSPVFTDDFDKTFLKRNKPREYNLNDYFKDPDGEPLTFSISEQNDAVTIQAEKLIISSSEALSRSFSVTASDARGAATAGDFTINVVPFLLYYKNAIIILAFIAFALFVTYIALGKNRPDNPKLSAGDVKFVDSRFEGYFLNTLSGREIPVLNWNAALIDNKRYVSLGDLLDMMDVPEKLPEARKIFFEAGHNNALIVRHMTDCIVTFNKKDIPRGKKEILHHDDKLYITFEDHATEIEFRYKRAKRTLPR